MLRVLVLGSGCTKCQVTTGIIERVAEEQGVAVEVGKITDHDQILGFGVLHTPAVMVDGQLVHSGGIPTHRAVGLWLSPKPLELLNNPSRHMFFTGKGGVGKTSLSTAVALYLADSGKKVLLVSTDTATNLDEMLGVELKNTPVAVPQVPGLSILNIDPDSAAEAYRQRVVAQMAADSTDADWPPCASSCRAPAPPRSPPLTSLPRSYPTKTRPGTTSFLTRHLPDTPCAC